MHTFDQANETLRADLEAYERALHTIVELLPRARDCCDQVVKETRLIKALLAFYTGPHAADMAQLAFHMTNLWPYREQPFARTLGFADEIAETRRQQEEAMRGVRMLARYANDPLAHELSTCFGNIAELFEDQRALLIKCHELIHPHALNMDLTCKRLDLLVAMVDARLPPSDEQQVALGAYTDAAALMRDWKNGVPLEKQGVEILSRCLDMLDRINVIDVRNNLRVGEGARAAEPV